jgi:serine/threonine-protein kinase
MGRVYGGRDTLLGGVPVAVKFLSQTLLNSKMRERFEREATTCALLGQRSEHIIRVTDYGVNEDGIPFYVMEYLAGESLSEIIMRHPLFLPQFLDLTLQICFGLECAHRGIPIDNRICPIIHRDIKPSNILITRSDRGEVAKILDFGIAKTLEADGGQTNCFMGTLAYSSPEQMEGSELDNRSDIYSLGIMMFQMLTGKMPLQANTHTFPGWYKAHHVQPPRSFQEVNPNIDIPKALETLVMACLAKSPGDRPQSVVEIIQTLSPLAKRYDRNREVRDGLNRWRTGKTIKSKSPEDLCRLAVWPTDKPIAEIVFPHIFLPNSQSSSHSKDSFATLWVMLPRRDISALRVCIPHNKFMFLPSPHPVMLWLTVLYSYASGPRWLPCYLDLKKRSGQDMTKLLSESKQYRVLFFALENPQQCAQVMTLNIAEPGAANNPELIEMQSKMLREFSTLGLTAPTVPGQLDTSKSLLRAELDKIKPAIVQGLEATGSSTYFSGGK